MRAVKQWRADLAERQSAARELRVARNRFVLRAHERLARDAVRQKDDDRSRRMDALKVTPLLPCAGERAAILRLLFALQVPAVIPLTSSNAVKAVLRRHVTNQSISE